MLNRGILNVGALTEGSLIVGSADGPPAPVPGLSFDTASGTNTTLAEDGTLLSATSDNDTVSHAAARVAGEVTKSGVVMFGAMCSYPSDSADQYESLSFGFISSDQAVLANIAYSDYQKTTSTIMAGSFQPPTAYPETSQDNDMLFFMFDFATDKVGVITKDAATSTAISHGFSTATVDFTGKTVWPFGAIEEVPGEPGAGSIAASAKFMFSSSEIPVDVVALAPAGVLNINGVAL